MAGAAPVYCNPDVLGYHLRADIQHDFGAAVSDTLNYANPPRGGVELGPMTEIGAADYFLTGAGRTVIEDFALRNPQSITFTLPEKTNTFQAWTPPVLYTTGNAAVGIVQDAGHYITDSLGANNVLTFGSVLDPATKPAGPERSPIWFDPSENNVIIPLDMFGFRRGVIDRLQVRDFVGGVSVKANYIIGDQTIDAIAMNPPYDASPVGKAKPISQVGIGDAGFFTSIKKAENIWRELKNIEGPGGRTIDQIKQLFNRNPQNFYIGKTLGDVTLVASAMQSFCDGTPNPYTGIGRAGTWKDINNNALATGPSILMLKTGDRLNWVRAIIMGVGAIYEDQPAGVRNTLQYKFFPARLSDEDMRTAILGEGFDAIERDVTARYDGVIASLNDLIGTGNADGVERVGANAIFVGEMQAVLTSPNGTRFGAEIVRRIQVDLDFLKRIVLEWVERRRGEAAGVVDLKTWYENTRVRANACSPTTRTIFVEKSGGPAIPMKVIVANVSPSAVTADPDWPFPVSIDIALRQAFGKLNAASSANAGIVGTDLQKRFFAKIALIRGVPAGGQRGGAGKGLLHYGDTVSPILNESRLLPLPSDTKLSINLRFNDPDEDLFADCPNIKMFRTYLEDVVMPSLRLTEPPVFAVVDNISTWYNTPGNACIDETLAGTIAAEWRMLQARGDIATETRPPTETRYTILFNAYSCCVNARNSRGFGEYQYEDTQSEQDFRILEIWFLNLYLKTPSTPVRTPLVMKRETGVAARIKQVSEVYPVVPFDATSGTSSSVEFREPAAAGTPQSSWYMGGLRERRPLYTKHVGGSAPTPRRGLYAGLRQRSGEGTDPIV